MLKLLIYGLNYYPEPTGTGKYTGEMAAWLASRGHHVDAIVAPPFYPAWQLSEDYKGLKFFQENINGVNVYRTPLYIPEPDKISGKTRIYHETSFSKNAARWWFSKGINKKYDVMIAVCPPLQIGVYPWIFSSLRKIPWVFHIQDLQVDAAFRLGILKSGMAGNALYKVESFLLFKASRVSTITEAMKKRIVAKGIPEEKVWLFPNWSDINFIKPMPRENSFRKELGLNQDMCVLMYAGNMGEKQGLELILDAANSLREDKRLKFILIGSGAARGRLESKAKKLNLTSVSFLPVQPWERVPEMLAAGDIHLVVQKREAADIVMPSKLTNILAAGKPSVATADPGTALYETLSNHKAGVVVPPENTELFVSGLVQLIDSPELREEMGKNARNYAEQYIDKEQILLDFEKKLYSLVRERG